MYTKDLAVLQKYSAHFSIPSPPWTFDLMAVIISWWVTRDWNSLRSFSLLSWNCYSEWVVPQVCSVAQWYNTCLTWVWLWSQDCHWCHKKKHGWHRNYKSHICTYFILFVSLLSTSPTNPSELHEFSFCSMFLNSCFFQTSDASNSLKLFINEQIIPFL